MTAAATRAVMMRWLAVTVLALVTAVALVPQAQAAFPGKNGALLVWGESRWTQKGDSNHRGEDPNACTRWYPKGVERPRIVGRVADDYGSDDCRTRDGLFRVGPGWSGVRLVTDRWSLSELEPSLSLSPRGTRIVFVTDRGLVRGLAVTTTRPGGRVRWLGVPGKHPRGATALSPSWSPSGERLVYEQNSPGPRVDDSDTSRSVVRVVRIDGRRSRTLTRGCAPVWSARDWIAFYRVPAGGDSEDEGCVAPSVREAGIFVIRPDGTGLRRIVRGTLTPVESEHPLAWSPDGRVLGLVAADRTFVDPIEWVYRVGAAGAGLRRIAQTSDTSDGSGGNVIGHPVWSPDGRLIAFAFNRRTFLVPSNPPRPVQPNQWRKTVTSAVPLDWESWR